MSEKPTISSSDIPLKEGTQFGIHSVEDRIDLHLSSLPAYPQGDTNMQRSVLEKTTVEIPRLSEVAVRGLKLARLNEVRDLYKNIEETSFIQDKAA